MERNWASRCRRPMSTRAASGLRWGGGKIRFGWPPSRTLVKSPSKTSSRSVRPAADSRHSRISVLASTSGLWTQGARVPGEMRRFDACGEPRPGIRAPCRFTIRRSTQYRNPEWRESAAGLTDLDDVLDGDFTKFLMAAQTEANLATPHRKPDAALVDIGSPPTMLSSSPSFEFNPFSDPNPFLKIFKLFKSNFKIHQKRS